MVLAFLRRLLASGPERQSSTVAAPQPQRTIYYKLFAQRGQVTVSDRYRRPNADGSHYFEGTTLQMRIVPDMQSLTISCEGLYDVAGRGDVVEVVHAPYEVAFLNVKSSLPVLLINKSNGGFHLIEANIGKCADEGKGGTSQLRKEIADYAQTHLKVTFV